MESFKIGPFAFSTNLALLVAVLIVIFTVALRVGRKSGVEIERPLWIILLTGVLAGRIPFVIVYRDMYMQAPWTILDIRDGGFNAMTSVAGALVTAFVLTRYVPSLRKPLSISLGLGVLLWGAGNALLSVDTKQISVPPITLTSLEGGAVAIDSLGGKPMVINLWATWCPPCRREMPVLRDAQQTNRDIVFVFANQGESVETVRTFLNAEALVLDNVLLDGKGALARDVGSVAMPTTLFFDSAGKLVDTRVGELSGATLAQRLNAIRSPRQK